MAFNFSVYLLQHLGSELIGDVTDGFTMPFRSSEVLPVSGSGLSKYKI